MLPTYRRRGLVDFRRLSRSLSLSREGGDRRRSEKNKGTVTPIINFVIKSITYLLNDCDYEALSKIQIAIKIGRENRFKIKFIETAICKTLYT